MFNKSVKTLDLIPRHVTIKHYSLLNEFGNSTNFISKVDFYEDFANARPEKVTSHHNA